MIRVIYRWTVEATFREAFIEEWERLTRTIRSDHEGSYGSTLLHGDDDTLVGVARWESTAHLEAFRDRAGSIHLPGAHLQSIEVLNEIADLTQ